MNDNLNIRASYDELCETEFFEWCAVNNIDPALLDEHVREEYELWIYINEK